MGYIIFQEARRNLWPDLLYLPQKLQALDFSVTQEEVNCLLPTISVPVPRYESTIKQGQGAFPVSLVKWHALAASADFLVSLISHRASAV